MAGFQRAADANLASIQRRADADPTLFERVFNANLTDVSRETFCTDVSRETLNKVYCERG